MEQEKADEVLLSSDEDLLMAKYEFYLELLENYKQDKEKEQSFVTVRRIISSAHGPAVRQPLNELISTYNSELRNLEKGRKSREMVIKDLNEMVELIEQTDLLRKVPNSWQEGPLDWWDLYYQYSAWGIGTNGFWCIPKSKSTPGYLCHVKDCCELEWEPQAKERRGHLHKLRSTFFGVIT